jgi:Fe-S-cluster-containing dehydrogenase component
MDIKRRDFLKVAGITTLAGLGGTAVVGRLVAGAQVAQAAGGHGSAQAGGAEQYGNRSNPDAKRYGMIINLKSFRDDPTLGEKIVEACHTYNNVPDIPNPKDEIKWIWMTRYENAFHERPHRFRDEATEQQELPVLCNHCDSPPCVRVCPTKATFRNKDGVVVMDYHRCIGCRFCMAACPYGMRSFNWLEPAPYISNLNLDKPRRMRGVVEKCNFCVGRIEVGKLPACVEACGESKALVFGDLNDPDSEIRKQLRENHTILRNPSLGRVPSVFYIV